MSSSSAKRCSSKRFSECLVLNAKRQWQPTPVLLPGESHGQRSLVGYSPRGQKEYSSVGKDSACNAGDPGLIPALGRFPGEGNGNPLHYSCLENPRDRGACWVPSMVSHRVRHD